MGPPPAGPTMVGFSLTSASFRSVSRGARSRNSTQGSQAPVTSAVSELRFDYPALRDLALAGAALVRADARLVQLEAAGHGPSAITLERTDHVVVGRVGRQDVFPGVALSVRQQRPELAASPEDARAVVERDGLGRLARLREAPGDRSRGTPHEHGQRERNVDDITPHLGSPVPPDVTGTLHPNEESSAALTGWLKCRQVNAVVPVGQRRTKAHSPPACDQIYRIG